MLFLTGDSRKSLSRCRSKDSAHCDYNSNVIGSLSWRLLHYGPNATLKYLCSSRRSKTFVPSHNLSDISLKDFGTLLLGLSSEQVQQEIQISHNRVSYILDEMRAKQKENFLPIKSVLNEDASRDRLIVLDLIVRNYFLDIFLETGTQHGISAAVVGATQPALNNTLTCYSFDVRHNHVLSFENTFKYIQLRFPARRNFKRITKAISSSRLLFFHDSDHSYENMTFEFIHAWDVLKARILLSDDIDGNSAFQDFCTERNLMGYRLFVAQGPALGVVFR